MTCPSDIDLTKIAGFVRAARLSEASQRARTGLLHKRRLLKKAATPRKHAAGLHPLT